MTGERPRIVVIDDDTPIREGLGALLPELDVVARFSSVEAFLAADIPREIVVLQDLQLNGAFDPELHPTGNLPVAQGSTAVKQSVAAGYRVLLYTSEHRRLVLAACLSVGAVGVVHKTDSLETLVEAVHLVSDGGSVITPALAGLADVLSHEGQLPALSLRQRQVLSGRARGQSFRLVARSLGISERTAQEYMGHVTAKFADYLRTHSTSDLERALGVGPGDMVDHW